MSSSRHHTNTTGGHIPSCESAKITLRNGGQVVKHNEILISQPLDFPGLTITQTKIRFPWICFTNSNTSILLPNAQMNFRFSRRFE